MSKTIERSQPDLSVYQPKEDDQVVICRCEEITKGEVRQAIHQGMVTTGELRRYLRIGMGLCQGQTCQRLVAGLLAKELGVNPGVLLAKTSSRAPVRPIPMGVYAKDNWSDVKGGKRQ